MRRCFNGQYITVHVGGIMLTFFNAVPDRYPDGRNIAFVEGMHHAGFTQVDSVDADYALTWNLRSREAREALSRAGQVIVCEEGYTRHEIPDIKHFAIGIGGHNGSGVLRIGPSGRGASVFGLSPKPWRPERPGGHILLCDQRGFGSPSMASPEGFVDRATARIRECTNRRIIVRPHPRNRHVKPRKTTLMEDLENCHAVVTWASAAAITAVIQGVPAYHFAPFCAASPAVQAQWQHLPTLDNPLTSDTQRNQGLDAMAWQQFTIDEIRDGRAFRWLINGEEMR